MIENHIDSPGLSRRNLLKVGLCATAFLSTVSLTASLSGCSASIPANGFAILRDNDLTVLRALIPVMIAGSLGQTALSQASEDTLRGIDFSLAGLSPEMLKLTRQLFDVLALGLTRGPLTGVWGRWEDASAEQIRDFLLRWQNSSLDLLRMGHGSLLQLVSMAWYASPNAWAHCGYPGPPKI